MLSLSKFASRSGRVGTPLPSVFPALDMRRASFRYGATSMIAGKPGSYKSALALNLLTHWVRDHRLTALYFSADSDEGIVARRISSIVTGRAWSSVDADFTARNTEPYQGVLDSMDNARFIYHAVDFNKVAEKCASFEVAYGDYPNVVFIDNLVNFAEHPQDWDGMGTMLIEFDRMAREMNSHFCILHHASEAWGAHDTPVPSAAIQGKLTQLSRLAITTAKSGSTIFVCVVKNTNAPDDPGAQRPMAFQVSDSLAIQDDYRREMQ